MTGTQRRWTAARGRTGISSHSAVTAPSPPGASRGRTRPSGRSPDSSRPGVSRSVCSCTTDDGVPPLPLVDLSFRSSASECLRDPGTTRDTSPVVVGVPCPCLPSRSAPRMGSSVSTICRLTLSVAGRTEVSDLREQRLRVSAMVRVSGVSRVRTGCGVDGGTEGNKLVGRDVEESALVWSPVGTVEGPTTQRVSFRRTRRPKGRGGDLSPCKDGPHPFGTGSMGRVVVSK